MKPSSIRRNLLVQITFVCLLIKLVDFQMVQTSISKLAAIKKSDTYSSLDSVSSGTSRQNVGQSRSSADGQVKTTVIQSNKPVRRRYKRQVTSGGQPQDLKRDTPQPQGTSDRAQISSGDPGSSVTWLDPQQQQQIVPAANPSFEAAFQGELHVRLANFFASGPVAQLRAPTNLFESSPTLTHPQTNRRVFPEPQHKQSLRSHLLGPARRHLRVLLFLWFRACGRWLLMHATNQSSRSQ